MYERFTDRLRKSMQNAHHEASRLKATHIRASHLLLGLIQENGVSASLLKNLDVDTRKLKLELEKLLPNEEHVFSGRLPHDLTTEIVIRAAIEESRLMNFNYVGTEHLLLGLLHSSESPHYALLMSMLPSDCNTLALVRIELDKMFETINEEEEPNPEQIITKIQLVIDNVIIQTINAKDGLLKIAKIIEENNHK